MTTDFTDVFGGSPVSPSQVAFLPYTFGTNLTLFWPDFSNGQPNIAARFMNMTATAGSLDVFMPDATLVSVGYDVIIFNAGSNTFNVVSANGNAIATIAAGETYYILLIDNGTEDGTWQTVQFGIGTGSASAAALAGAGLLAAAGVLNVNFDAIVVNTSYSIISTARAILQVWTGGSGVITLPTAASVGDGFFFPLANNGTGSVSVATTGGDQIDGAASSNFVQTQSGFVISSGTAWYTVGKGIENTFAITLLNLNVGGSSDITETSAQAQNIIQQYTGVLTGNINVIVPNTVQMYLIYNNTSGSFTLTVKTAAGTGIQVTQGTHTILYCDGTNVVPGFTAVIGNSLTLPVGSASAPTLNFQSDTTTGIYSSASHHLSITSQGTEVADFFAAASAVNYLSFEASATMNPVLIAALGSDTDIGITVSPKGAGVTTIGAANLTGTPVSTTPSTSDSSTRIATTAYVKAQVSASSFSGGTVGGSANVITIGSTTPSNWTLTDGNLITFTPVNVNTGATTVNILATGALPLKKITFSGIGNVAAGDVNTTSPIIAEYNASGGYYIFLNLVAYGTLHQISTTTAINFTSTWSNFVATTSVTLNVTQSINLRPWWYIGIYAQGGPITININAADQLNGGAAGTGFTMPQGTSGVMWTDANGNLYLSGTTTLLSSANTWTAAQSFNSSDLILKGSSSGTTTLNAAAAAGTTILTLPAATDTLAVLGTAQTWTAAQTFTNSDIKLLGSSTGATTFSSANAGASNFTLTFPAATDTLVGAATTNTLTNKTFDTAGTGNSFSINGVAVTANTGTGAVVRAASATVAGLLGTISLGTGTDVSNMMGMFFQNTSQVGNNAGGGTTTLMTATLAANTFAATKVIRITAFGVNSNNANTKTLTLNFGGTIIFTRAMTTNVANEWSIQAYVIGSGSNTQVYAITNIFDGATSITPSKGNATETTSSSIVVKMTGAATGSADIIQQGFIIEYMN